MKLGGLVLTIAALTLAGCAHTPPPVSDAVASYYSNPPEPTLGKVSLPQTARPKVADASALLADPAREWSMTLLGDSTGNDSNEFTFILAKQMSDHYDRPVIMHRWLEGGYTKDVTIGAGPNAPIHIWNGSVTGSTGDYAVDHMEKIAHKADLVMINYGHNYKSSWAAETITLRLVRELDQRISATAMLFVFQNPQNPESAYSTDVRNKIRSMTTDAGYESIDVYQAFKDTSNVGALMLDSVHPNPAGSKVWADAVSSVLLG